MVEHRQQSLLAKFGMKYSVDPTKMYETLCKTVFKEAKSPEQVMALLVVADQYDLNPFTKEIFAFPDQKGGVVPVVGIDGWNRIAQQHPQFDGVELRYSDEMSTPTNGKECPEWIEAVVYRKDRQHPVIIREYRDECFRNTGPWQSHTKRMLRHKALIQGYRVAFGFHGIYDQDEAEGFIDIAGSPIGPPSQNRPEVDFSPPAIEAPEKPSEEPAGVEGGEKPAADATDATAAQEAPTEKAKDESDDLGL